MLCSKIGGECPHTVLPDDNYVFVMMPFEGFTSVYDAIKTAVERIDGKSFTCDRADDQYTNLSIWCNRICKNIRKAKYVVVDTTGKNPNVFYELGFAHALENSKAIIITQKIEDAPFDIKDINHIGYSHDNLPELRDALKDAILALEKESEEQEQQFKSTDETLTELRVQVRSEEERAGKYKKELQESEDRERKLKEQIRELEAIQKNPEKEAMKAIAELEGTIAKLKKELEFTEKDKKEQISNLQKNLSEKETLLKSYEEKLKTFQSDQNEQELRSFLSDSAKRQAESFKWFIDAYDETEKGNHTKAIQYYSKAIEIDPANHAAYNNRGASYDSLKQYDKAIADYTKAIELNPDNVVAYLSLAEVNIFTGGYVLALDFLDNAISLVREESYQALSLYLRCIALILLGRDISEIDVQFNSILEKNFVVTWSFNEIETWLQEADVPEDKKKYILEKTELLKKHKV